MRRIGASVASALMVLLVGCSEDPVTAPTKADYVARSKEIKNAIAKGIAGRKRAAPAAAPAAAGSDESGFGVVDEGYAYDAAGKRDPFRSFQYGSDGVEETGFGPLGDYELEQLAVVAVVWDTNNPRALVADPGGRSFVVREGSPIGKNKGRVIHIGDNLVLVKETYVDFAGEQTTKDVEMRIRRSQGG